MEAVQRSRCVYLVATTACHRAGVTHFAHGGRPGPILLTPGLLADLRRVGPFLCVGLVGFAVDAAAFSGLHGAGLARPAARALSLALATVVTFGLNRTVTFAARAGRDRPGEFMRYGLVTLVVQGFSYGLFLLLATRLPNLAALFAGAAAATVFSFAGQRLFTFRAAAPGPAASLAAEAPGRFRDAGTAPDPRPGRIGFRRKRSRQP